MGIKVTKFNMLNNLVNEIGDINKKLALNLYVIDVVSKKIKYKEISEEYNKHNKEGKDIKECINNINNIVQKNKDIRGEIRQLFNRFIKENISLV